MSESYTRNKLFGNLVYEYLFALFLIAKYFDWIPWSICLISESERARLNLLPAQVALRVRQDIEATNDTLSRDYKPSESSFLALRRNLRQSTFVCRPYMCFCTRPCLLSRNVLLISFSPSTFPPVTRITCTHGTYEPVIHEWGWCVRRGGQWIHLKREYDYSFDEGEIFVASSDLSTEICVVMETSSESKRNEKVKAKTLAEKGSVVASHSSSV